MSAKSKNCLVCGKQYFKRTTYRAKEWGKSKYCSQQCHNEGALKAPRIVACAGCGREFRRNTKDGVTKAKYCSYNCYIKYRDITAKSNYNPNRHSSEQVECACGCGTLIAKYDYRGRLKKYVVGHTMVGKERTFTPEWLERIRQAGIENGKNHRGEKHWNWKGGITPLIRLLRHTPEYNAWRHAVYARDNWTCQDCGRHCGTKDIVAHHKKSFKDYWDLRYNVDNGITLCRKCHLKREKTVICGA